MRYCCKLFTVHSTRTAIVAGQAAADETDTRHNEAHKKEKGKRAGGGRREKAPGPEADN